MSPVHRYNVTTLCALINGGQVGLPLSHTRSLQVIAALEGARDWFALAHRADAVSLKARARTLRSTLNQLCVGAPLSESAGAVIIEKILSVGGPGPISETTPSALAKTSAASGTAKRKRPKLSRRNRPRSSALSRVVSPSDISPPTKKENQNPALDPYDPIELMRSGLVIPDGGFPNGHSWDAVDVTSVDGTAVALTIRPIDPQEHREIPSVGYLWLANVERVQEFLRAKEKKTRFRLATRTEAAFFDPDLSLGDWGITVINFHRFPKELQNRIKAAGFSGDRNGSWDNGEPAMESRIGDSAVT